MPRVALGMDVLTAAVERMRVLYEAGHRIVVSFSGGKDSGVALEVCILAARAAGTLPVEVVMRDEEVMYPGTFEYAERLAGRPEMKFHWVYANQPIVNVFNRASPYFWVFDPMLPPEQWVRRPPTWAEAIGDKNIEHMTTPARFPPAPGKRLFAVLGLRVQESRARLYGLFSSKSYVTAPNRLGVSNVWPIYDWGDGDVWHAIKSQGWDYNSAYDVLYRLGLPRRRLRIAPPTLNQAGVEALQVAAKAWPQWFERVCQRLPGARLAALYGRRAALPHRRLGETWEQVFTRECIEQAPAEWIHQRALLARERVLSMHRHHSTQPMPDVEPCYTCQGDIGSWKALAIALYNGDPFSMKVKFLPYVEPEFFRAGAGTWGGSPTW